METFFEQVKQTQLGQIMGDPIPTEPKASCPVKTAVFPAREVKETLLLAGTKGAGAEPDAIVAVADLIPHGTVLDRYDLELFEKHKHRCAKCAKDDSLFLHVVKSSIAHHTGIRLPRSGVPAGRHLYSMTTTLAEVCAPSSTLSVDDSVALAERLGFQSPEVLTTPLKHYLDAQPPDRGLLHRLVRQVVEQAIVRCRA